MTESCKTCRYNKSKTMVSCPFFIKRQLANLEIITKCKHYKKKGIIVYG